MKIKIKELRKDDDSEGDQYEFCGLEPGGVYDVLALYEELESMVIKNKNGRSVMVRNFEVELYED